VKRTKGKTRIFLVLIVLVMKVSGVILELLVCLLGKCQIWFDNHFLSLFRVWNLGFRGIYDLQTKKTYLEIREKYVSRIINYKFG